MTVVIDQHLLDRIARERRFDDRTIAIATRLFLDGDPPKKLALEYAVILQRIYAIRQNVIDIVAGYRLQPGYSQVTLTGPKELVDAISELFHQQMRDLGEATSASSAHDRP